MVAEVIALRWMPQDLTDDKSTLVQVMAWCRQATSHYLGQCWPRSVSPNGVTRPQWVKFWMDWMKHENIFAFSIISWYWDGPGRWNPLSWKSRTSLSNIVNNMAADDLAMQGARVSAAMILTLSFWNILTPAPDGLNKWPAFGTIHHQKN